MTILPSQPRATNVRWLIVLMLMGFTFLGHFNRVSISVAGNERFTKPGGISTEQMGLVYSSFLLVYTLGMLPGGWVIDRIGPRRALTGMALGMGACVILTGALGWIGLTIASLWWPLMMIRGVAGAVSVPLHPAAARTVSLWMPMSSRVTANGCVTAGALIGIALTYPVFGFLMDELDWPLAFVVSGATMMVFALVWWAFAADDPVEHRWSNSAEQALIHEGVAPAPRVAVRWDDIVRMFRNRGLVVLALSYAALSYFQYLFFYWIEHYFEKELQLPVSESRRAAFYVTMAMALGMSLGGFGTDMLCRRVGQRWGCRGMAMLGMGLSALFGWLGVSAHEATHVVLLFSVAMATLGWCEGIFWTYAPILEPRSGGLAAAFLNTVGNAGGFLAPIFTPMIGEHYGWTAAIVVASLVCGTGAILWLAIDTAPRNALQTDAHS